MDVVDGCAPFVLTMTLEYSPDDTESLLGFKPQNGTNDHDYTKYEQSIALMASNLLCLMVVTYYNVPVFVAILVYVGIYSLTRKALTHDLLQHASHTS